MEQTREQQMYALIEQWESSELTINNFCKQHEVKYATFHYWRKKRQGSRSGFVALQPPAHTESQMELHYPNGVRLLIPADTSLPALRQLICLPC